MWITVNINAEFQKTDQDITVYKVMRKKKYLFGLITRWETPGRHSAYVGCIHNGTEFEAKGRVMCEFHRYSEETVTIGSGIIQTFETKQDCKYLLSFKDDDCFVFECVIPKGAEFIRSVEIDKGPKMLGATKIRFIRQVDKD